jgi:tetratricopeptide (TPR) repeat protein
MARRSTRDDPLSGVGRLLRELRAPATARNQHRRTALLGAVAMALFRLPLRQREIVRRYDLGGESAAGVQRSLSLSARQFFRDRRCALAVLSRHLVYDDADKAVHATYGGAVTRIAISDSALAGKTFARSLAQSGNSRCLDALQRLAAAARKQLERADLLLELAETAIDYSDDRVAEEALAAASTTVCASAFEPAIADWLSGRLARAQAHLAATPWEGAEHFALAISSLRRSIAREPSLLEPRASLSDVLGDHALLEFTIGSFAESRAASAEAVDLIESFSLARRPKALETLAMHEAIHAVLSGRTATAVTKVATLLGHAGESGWSSTASWLGGVVVGLNGISGDYHEAIRWYESMAPLALTGARPRDRSSLMLEAAHAYTMTGQPKEALSILGYVRPGDGCPRTEIPEWHLYAAAALQRIGDDRSALNEASEALAGFTAQGPGRGLADAHRHVATCQAKLGSTRTAREHLAEARRLTEHHGTPYALLRTLAAEATILQSATCKREAAEYAKLLHGLARSS